jgi:hypothetical protein
MSLDQVYSSMNESSAKAALRQLGIAPAPELIRNWIRAAEAEHSIQADEPELTGEGPRATAVAQVCEPTSRRGSNRRADGLPQGNSPSNLEPLLLEQGTFEKTPGRRKAGRPRIIASWFPAVAQTMADGTSLRAALAINRLYLSKSEMRALYRNTTFKAMYQEARRRFLIEHFGRRPTLRARVGRLP